MSGSVPYAGPSTPQGGVTTPATQLPAIETPAGVPLWFVGAHGGAGTTTLSQLVPGSGAVSRAWPASSATCVLVCRSNLSGLRAGQAAMVQWAAGAAPSGVALAGMVVVADADGRLPRELRQLADLLAGGVPRCWHLPWVESWRTSTTPQLVDLPHAARRVVQDLVDVARATARP